MRSLRLVLALAAALVLAGCTAIPTSGPVQAGPTSVPDDPTLVFQPYPPPQGASPTDIVDGFVQAASAGADHTVAKEFLTSAFAARWQPDAQVLVHNQGVTAKAASTGRVTLTVPTIARVDGSGVYHPTAKSTSLPYTLTRVSGQWRISDGPMGVVLDQEVFAHNFQQTTLQYFDPTWQRLVPDLRWFPSPVSPTRIVRALLGARAAPLAAPVTSSAFADGTRLVRVTSSDGVVTVAVDVPGAAPSAAATTRMQQQLVGSLPSRSSAVRLVVDGRQAPAAQPLDPVPSATQPAVLVDGRFGLLDQRGALVADAVLGKGVAAAKPTAITVSSAQRLAAVLRGDGDAAVVSPTSTRVVDTRSGLVAPTLDQRGWTFTVPGDDPEGLWATAKDGTRVTLPVTLEAGAVGVVAIEASPDGTRLLVLTEDDSGASSVAVAGIERSVDGTPIGLSTSSYSIPVGTDRVQAATWVDDGSVALLTAGSQGYDVSVQPLGGPGSSLGRLPGAVASIAGGAQQGGPRVLTGDTGDLYTSAGDNQWEPEFDQPVGASVLAVQR